jgi:signal transduction histidine kinase/ligand-binding sensor domain-containing protein
MVQTHDGYLWLGTLGGLARFDGTEFTVFNSVNTPAIKSDRVRTLYEDATGTLWIGTEHGGLTRYSHGVFTNFSTADGLPDTSVLSLGGNRQGDLWIGTLRGLARLRDGVFSRFGPESGLPPAPIEVIFQDSQGNLWLGADSLGLLRYTGGKTTTYAAKDGVNGDVSAVGEDPSHALWVGTTKGLTVFDETMSDRRPRSVHLIGGVQSIYLGAAGTMWVATSHGLFRFTDGAETRFAAGDGRSTTSLRSLLIDREQNLWIGTDGGGLNRWRRSNVRVYTAAQGLTDRPTISILQDHEQTIWIGAPGGHALFAYRHGRFSAFHPHQARMETPASLAEDHDGKLWLGDWKYGLGRLSIESGRLKHYTVPGLSPFVVRALYVDTEGALWIGADRAGLFRFKDGSFTNYRAGDGLLSNTVAFITEDRDHALWIGTPAGISRWKNGAFTNYQASGLSLVRTIHQDDHGDLWVGTYGYGLFRFKNGSLVQITSRNGLFDDVASTILEDGHGNLWMSGNRGIFRASEADLNAFADGRLNTIHCISYGVSDGMITAETNGNGEPAGVRAADGALWFPMVQGAVAIDPNLANTLPPPVVIEQVLLDGIDRPSGQTLEIAAGKRDLEIHYAALSFTRPQQVAFKYRLLGLDSDWVDAGTRRTAYYSQLPPGTYTFKVIADNGEGVWNEEGQSLKIEVLPPFWRTWWFLTLAALGLLGLATMVYRIREAVWKRAHAARETFSRQLLVSQEAERQRIAAELHDSLGQSLLIIKNRAVLALHSLPDAESAREQLEEISAGASQAVEEVREISYNLRPYQLDRFGLAKALKALCAQASNSSGISISPEVEAIDGLFPKESETSIYRIAQEAVNNIIKHSLAAEATLTLRRKDGVLLLSIHDNGRGFQQTAEANPAETRSAGFGLVGIAERARMMRGNSEITSSASLGTTITVRIPLPEGAHAE